MQKHVNQQLRNQNEGFNDQKPSQNASKINSDLDYNDEVDNESQDLDGDTDSEAKAIMSKVEFCSPF